MGKGQTYKREQVVGIINSVLGKIKAPQELSRESLGHELTELKQVIEGLRTQLNAAQPDDISNTHIPSAKDELDAVIGATEQATVTIMDSCEKILEDMKGSDAVLYGRVETYIVKIFEACTFQDITGQRIKKVMKSLKQIETMTNSVLRAIEGELVELDPAAETKSSEPVSLLNGPALPQNALTQDTIDQLLAEFDTKA